MANGISIAHRAIQPEGWRLVPVVRTEDEFEAIKGLVDRVYRQKNVGRTVHGTITRLGQDGEPYMRQDKHGRREAKQNRRIGRTITYWVQCIKDQFSSRNAGEDM